ncbi:MAG: NUDIX domain-containing protein [Candidatus Paceibacterota bacterium]
MESKKDYSYGIVPIHKDNQNQFKVLLIDQYSPVKGNYYWIFPKGHAEEGERPEETALRELCEETGLVPTSLSDETFEMRYEFLVGETAVDKRVIFYIGYIDDITVELQLSEVREARWLSLEEARELLTYQNAKDVLAEVEVFLKKTGGE